MGFLKWASVQHIGAATYEGEGLQKLARAVQAAHADAQTAPVSVSQLASYYIDGARKIDVPGMLVKAAGKYDISSDPTDYIFEAIRANSTNVPNENHDAFHRNELLRFDTRLGMPVYLTYVGKPHHLNHKADDPKRARGVILDSHYNDSSPALANCLTCNYRTAEESGRDPSGIHCAKCGSVVKDEFVEILVGVDTKKDPALARGIRAGVLNAGSMGCNCASTACNICSHVARSVNEFCEHIRGASKGSLWLKAGGEGTSSAFEKVSADKVKALLKKANYSCAFEGNQLVAVSLVCPELGFEVRKAFENCQGVEFDEYSRVHRPADPKARTVEILKAAEAPQSLTLEQETEQLIMRARLQTPEDSMAKAASAKQTSAQTFYAVRINDNDDDIHVAASLKEAVRTAQMGRRDKADYFTVEASSLPNAMMNAAKAIVAKTAQMLPMSGDVQLVIPDGAQVQVNDQGQMVGPDGQPMSGQMPGGMPGGAPGEQMPGQAPGGPGMGGPKSIEDVTQNEMKPQDQKQSPEEFGMLPPGASAEGLDASAEGEMGNMDMPVDAGSGEEPEEKKYAAVYGDFEVEVFSDRAILSSPGGELFTVQATSDLDSDNSKRKFGGALIDSVLSNGLVRTALKYKAAFSEKFAGVDEGAMFDMKEGRPMEGGGVLEGAITNMKESRPPMKSKVTEDYDDDMKATRPMPTSVIESRDTDMKDEAKVESAGSAVDGADDNMKEKRPSFSMSQGTDEGAEFDMKNLKTAEKAAAKAVEERVRKLYAGRLEKMKADYEAEKTALEATLTERFARALKVAARRQALNLETSPLKVKMVDSLTVQRPVGRHAATGADLEWAGMDQTLALHLVEAAWHEAAREEVDTLVGRAAELMTYDNKYLIDAEKDLSKQASVIPQVVSVEELEPVGEMQHRASSMRRAASTGNLMLAPGTADPGAGSDKLSAIREALGPTHVGRMLNEEFRSN